MTWSGEIETIRQLLRSNWSTTEIAWPGEHYDKPDMTGSRSSPACFVEVVINHNPATQEAMTAQGVRSFPGLITLMIQTETDVGDKILRTYADSLAAIFRAASPTADRIWFDEPSYRYHGEWGEWLRADLDIPYRRLESFGVTDAAELAGAVSDAEVVSQASHGFAVGDWIEFASSTWSKAVADGVSDLNIVGVVSVVQDSDTFSVTMPGSSVVITAHGWALGPLWLHTSTAGTVTSTKPTSALSPGAKKKQVATATTANRVAVQDLVAIDL